MTESKFISITGVTSNETKQQFDNFKNMVLPEMLLNRLNSDTLKQNNNLKIAMESLNSGLELLRLFRSRVNRLKTNNELFPDDGHTMLKEVDNELNIIAKTLGSTYNTVEHQLNDAITSALLIGYHTGAHDMRVNLERHANNGFQKAVLDPQKGGKTKAGKVEPLKRLIDEMAIFLYTNSCLGKFTKEYAASAIFQVLYEFNLNNKSYECFSAFTNNEMKEQFVKRNIKHLKKVSTLKSPPVSKLVQVLKINYKNSNIKKTLK